MSLFLNQLQFFKRAKEPFSNGHGITTQDSRAWEDAYRKRWQQDKIVRSTHGVNCTGSCSWKVYVKGGLVTWEIQATDYPRTHPELPNHEPRGCNRGASYSWYLYSANRLKYPLVRRHLLQLWREARQTQTPVAAWKSIVENPEKRKSYTSRRGLGGFVRSCWEEVNEMIAAANAYTIKTYGPDRIAGFSPIPAMSMISYASGARYLSLLGGVCLSFYDWYCDLPPSSPMTWGEQTDVSESADWYNAGYLILWGSNVPQTRTPDAHFYSEARYKGTKSAVVSPDYAEATKFSDLWLRPKQGTDAALALAMGHVILKEFHVQRQVPYFNDYVRLYSDMPMLVKLEKHENGLVPGKMLRADDFTDALGEQNNPKWKTIAFDENGNPVAPLGSIGFRWGEEGLWHLQPHDKNNTKMPLKLSLLEGNTQAEIESVLFPYFGGKTAHDFASTTHGEVLERKVPVTRLTLKDGEALVTTVYDLICAHYGIDRGLNDPSAATSYDEDKPFTPAWAEHVTEIPRNQIIHVAREFAMNAEQTNGKSMVILGAGLNHWYHMDMAYRGIINMLVFCGCIGQSGGGWSHYVGQEKLRPQTGWAPIAFGLDWNRPPRHMNGTSFFYTHSNQWRYETLNVSDILSPLAPEGDWSGSPLDYNTRAIRMGWLPSAPQLKQNSITLAQKAEQAGQSPAEYVAAGLHNGSLEMACEDPDHPDNWPRNLFVWRSNLLGSSGKGHEYFLKYLLGTNHGVLGNELPPESPNRPHEVQWHEKAPEGKLDLLVTLDFRMSTTCVYSDIVLPTASWYEKNDLNTSDMHPFIHPLSAAVDPVWESRSDWDIYRELARTFSKVAPEVLSRETDVVLTPLHHDSAEELAQPDVVDWKKSGTLPISGVTMPKVTTAVRDYPNIYEQYISIGPLLEKIGNGGKGIGWDTKHEVEFLRKLNGTTATGGASLHDDIDAAEAVLSLAPETNGEVAVKAWKALGKITGQDHTHLAVTREDDKIRFRDIVAQPRKVITSPTWSGIENENVCYNAGYTNVHEMIPWRTLSGRQELYLDHAWMRAFGEAFVTWRPPVDTKTIGSMLGKRSNGNKEIVLNFLTPHQKWGIHSTYSDNLLMLSLNRGGSVVWISEKDAAEAGIVDNDWIEVFNTNGALTARAVVSQRILPGMTLMYHAQEKIINIPGSELTGQRGGIHNSVTRTVLKPTHMIGGYAQFSYGFNYYGTVGSNRDEFVIIRKMKKIDWMMEGAAQ
ncbi:nitrate reductase subunit alpha [Entomobacter blattae]|uniref:nitrate reductase (quinone) n=1 Tax=Entomobacter blattae TaxID=2762277 RepID=A0A7H1NQX3_9PROT|nr:nitrate reductase subunit alpha [Entomobacter blattae]QNT78183.1 Respiratory nitrate reductase 1 alpha chain [Entomobacter blattae]